jgi:hypothetical protein
MRILALVAALLVTFSMSAAAQTYVDGYTRKDGTYVQGHWRSAPDHSPYNNYSYPGNTNPYTGRTATGNTDTYLQRYYNRWNSSSSYTAPRYTVPSYPRSTNRYRSGWSNEDE